MKKQGQKYHAKDIARIANVSPATVSLILNHKPGVGEKTSRHVMEVIRRLGAEDLIAKSPGCNQGSIGFVIFKRHGEFSTSTPFYPLILERVEQEAKQYGYQITILYLNCDSGIREQVDGINHSKCKGLCVIATEMSEEHADILNQLRLPMVLIDNRILGSAVDSVVVDNEQATYDLVKYLYLLGHRRIGYLQSKMHLDSFDERRRGFLTARRMLLPAQETWDVYALGYSEEQSYLDFKTVIETEASLPTALCADNDVLAFGAIRALKAMGYSVPHDISVLGFDDRPICLMSDPPITSMRILSGSFARIVMARLYQRMSAQPEAAEGLLVPVSTRVNTVLVKRGSAAEVT